MISEFSENPYPGILVRPLPKPPYDAATSLARTATKRTSVPRLSGLSAPSPTLEEIVYSDRYPVVVKRRRFRFWHKSVVRTGTGNVLRTKASRLPRLMRAWGLWSLAAAWVVAHGIAESAGADPLASAFWLNSFLWFGLTSYFTGAFFGTFAKKRLELETTAGELVYQVRRIAGGILTSHFSLRDELGNEHLRLQRSGTQFFKRRWKFYDRLGGAGPQIVERSYLTALCRKLFGHLWGNFRARYTIWHNGITVGSIEREGFTNDRFRIEFWKEVPTLDPKLVATAVAFIDHQDPERWHPWFN